ncbi:MAG TPA: aconitate hydratase AcnA [Acidobacteriaceae bacterium]|nr:aconitate hydratase AcnA [Acidobacteriaceae bacterium]
MTSPGGLRDRCRVPLASTGRMIFSLQALAANGHPVARLPFVLRVILESLLRNCGNGHVTEADVTALAQWLPRAPRLEEIPFFVGRIVLQDVAGIPLLGDLAAMRDAMAAKGHSPAVVRPRVPVAMVVDHSISVDEYGTPGALIANMRIEAERNEERFSFAKWAVKAIDGIQLVPPGFGILHQVNLEYLAQGLMHDGDVCFPDTLVGTDSHSCMIAALGVVGWGVGGIEAEAAMLGQPVAILTPDVVAIELTGALKPGVTATDLVLHVTHAMRRHGVVGKFLEFIGSGVATLGVPDRATVANMAPEYGATIGYFPFDAQTRRYLLDTGRDPDAVALLEAYWKAQGCGDPPQCSEIDYSDVVEIDLGSVQASVAGPKRPQDLTELSAVPAMFQAALGAPREKRGYARSASTLRMAGDLDASRMLDGDVVIAAITSCTNTSNPDVMLQAGWIARNAVARGMTVPPWVKTSLAPGSLVVSRYLEAAGLQSALDTLGFGVVGYGCTTCVGNSGPLAPGVEERIRASGSVVSAVLSGNRNFEGRIHAAVDAAFLMSPPLVVAYALSGTMNADVGTGPIAQDRDGRDVYLADLWPTDAQLSVSRKCANDPALYHSVYKEKLDRGSDAWNAIAAPDTEQYPWDATSTYIRRPPYFIDPALQASSLHDVRGARILALLGDSITTDHISPIGNIARDSPAGAYLQQLGVTPANFNNYGARRMNAEVMTRGTFANRLLRNRLVDGRAGGITRHWPDGDDMSIYEAAMRYVADDIPTVIFGGQDYGMGSARDWAAKGTRLLGVRAVIAQSFERIHRSNLAGMGVLPCELAAGTSVEDLGLVGSETVDVIGVPDALPRQSLNLVVTRASGAIDTYPLLLRLDTLSEIQYVKCGSILSYVLSTL